jgi:hypothetical protein
MADLLNETFGKAFTREDTENVPDPEAMHRGENLHNVHVTVREVKEKIRKLKNFPLLAQMELDLVSCRNSLNNWRPYLPVYITKA